ncbi:hypothetical protein M3N64_02850 [Sporolactobacillus sp. CPB3-1]|uniref:Flagellar hook-length control protein-like C-terminal domain-containing protein n=1 Tax=Sporolactobacillus mangiferae TaxID=2940498 RepID=A0ABT0M7P1_9BACL|nr:hypothetical protein [Sporolactobacillus mangiferae]MCL1630881.1 hypothetical protein [Sporolactobacillus mangiferae]
MGFQPYAISQSQLIGTYAPEQILRGKVLDILPDRTALVQLGAKQVVAKVVAANPPLKVGQEYLFQIQQGTLPLTAKLVERKQTDQPLKQSMLDDAFRALQLKEDALGKQIVQSFLDHGDPLSRENILNAKVLLRMSSDVTGDLQTIRWMVNRQLPLNEHFFHIAQTLKTSGPLSTHADALLQLIQQTRGQSESVARLKEILSKFAVQNMESGIEKNNASKPQMESAGRTGELLKSFINAQLPNLDKTSRQQIADWLIGALPLKEATELMKKMNIESSPQALLKAFNSFVREQSAVNNSNEAPLLSNRNLLLDLFKQIGFSYEHQIAEALNQGADTDEMMNSLKGRLLAVVQDQSAPHALRHMAQEMAAKITGEQLQLASADPYVAQFSLQIPVPYQDGLTEVSVYWEGKRQRNGALDPNACTILLWLELTHLKETLVNIHVQNHAIAITVQNSSADLRALLAKNEPMLKGRLEQIGYELLSLSQSEKINRNLKKKATQPLAETNYRVDVKV